MPRLGSRVRIPSPAPFFKSLGDSAFAAKGGLIACVLSSVLIGTPKQKSSNPAFKPALDGAWPVYAIGIALIFVFNSLLETDERTHPHRFGTGPRNPKPHKSQNCPGRAVVASIAVVHWPDPADSTQYNGTSSLPGYAQIVLHMAED